VKAKKSIVWPWDVIIYIRNYYFSSTKYLNKATT